MSSIFDLDTDPGKFLITGDNGDGKTGAAAALVAEGYKVRMVDTDKGSNILKSLLTDHRYPYARLIEERNIDLREALDIQRLDIPMRVTEVIKRDARGAVISKESVLAPRNADAWLRIGDLLDNWRGREKGATSWGSVESWGPDHVLFFDTWTTISKYAYYFNQQLNGRLGARETGFDHQRDVGDAQRQLTRLLEAISNESIRCNVIAATHILYIDNTRGYNVTAEQQHREQQSTANAKGYPRSIGYQLPVTMGLYFNNIFTTNRVGTERRISTVPVNNVLTKTSCFLKNEYPVSTAYAEILATMRGLPEPTELIEACAAKTGPTRPRAILARPPSAPKEAAE